MEIEKAIDEQSFTHGFLSVGMPKQDNVLSQAFITEAVMMIWFMTEYTNDDIKSCPYLNK
jgi:hypothetical protein